MVKLATPFLLLSIMNFTAPIPLSLYIHLPWCVKKCPYCDFNSHALKHTLPEEEYVDALIRNLDAELPGIWGRRLISIFLGGGTPSLFSPKTLEKLLSAIYARMRFNREIEITLEANPGTVDIHHFKEFRKIGINRLSIGIQSLQDSKLKSLGRIHNREYALRAIDSAISAGFNNFNLDLMHGLPDQSAGDALQDLNDALQFKPPHLSWYQLTIEPNTYFYQNPPPLPPDEILSAIQDEGKNRLQEKNLHPYEVSAYAAPLAECIHNKNYWTFGDYLGIGAGAHSKLTDVEKKTIIRRAQVKHPKDFMAKDNTFTNQSEVLTQDAILFEFMLNALRLTAGVPTTLFTERTGLDIAIAASRLKILREKKLLIEDINHLCTTPLGERFLNDVIQVFLNN